MMSGRTRSNLKPSLPEEQYNEILSRLEKLDDLQKSTDEIKENTAAISRKVDHFEEKCEEIEQSVISLQSEMDVLKSRIEFLEKDSRRLNIIITGLEESEDEKTTDTVAEMIKNKLKVQSVMSSAFRIGPKQLGKIRPIKVTFRNQEDKWRVIKARSALKGTRIYINMDLSPKEQKDAELLRNFKKKAIELGRRTGFKQGKLMIDGTPYVVKDGTVVQDQE